MNVDVIAPYDQRRFLMVAFHPYGPDVCGLLGLPPTSLEVEASERHAAKVPWRDLMGYNSTENHHQRQVTTQEVFSYAYLYENAAVSLIEAHHPQYHRSIGEDLVSFFIALVALGKGHP